MPTGDIIGKAMLQTAKIQPILLPISDVYTALQTGLVDTVVNTLSGVIILQWHTKIKYITELPLAMSTGFLVVSNKSMQRILTKDRKIRI